MSTFRATNRSDADVPAERDAIWAALTDPDLLPRLTPLLREIETDGSLWTWHLTRIAALGVSVSPSFTERMRFTDGRRIDYTHEPPAGAGERTGAEGWYLLEDSDAGTHLSICLTLTVELPLPRLVAPAVEQVMTQTMARTGDRFSANLLRHLGVAGREQQRPAARRPGLARSR